MQTVVQNKIDFQPLLPFAVKKYRSNGNIKFRILLNHARHIINTHIEVYCLVCKKPAWVAQSGSCVSTASYVVHQFLAL